jgi:ATP-dependent Clp protease adaptor protein ClpS
MAERARRGINLGIPPGRGGTVKTPPSRMGAIDPKERVSPASVCFSSLPPGRTYWNSRQGLPIIWLQITPILRHDSNSPQTGHPFVRQNLFRTVMTTPSLVTSTFGPYMSDDGKKRKNAEDNNAGAAVITKTKVQTKRPSLYRVLLLNDDYTPMEFVVHVLERFFNKDRDAATQIMLHVHNNGIGECGIFTYEVAETKVTQVMDFARKHQHPLQCVMEKK